MLLLRQILPALSTVVPVFAGPNQGTPDIFADFHLRESVTGNHYYFRVLLDRPCAPTAVANFLGLATGARAWIDPATGLPSSEPFYEGLRVHKIVPASEIVPGAPDTATGEIHFGSPTIDGRGGPGYVFQDISLVPPGQGDDGAWQVYMDNDGPNTNGSRFFISGISQNLNDRHTRLGVVQPDSGAPYPLNNSFINLNAVGNAPTDANGKPFYKLTIESITIDGWDENDPTFLIDVWSLPEVDTAEFRIARWGGLWKLFGFAGPGAALVYQSSADLRNWGPLRSHVDFPGSGSPGIDISSDLQFSPSGFYRGSSVFYPEWPASELDLVNAILVFDYTDDLDDGNPATQEVIKLQFDFNGGGGGGDWRRWVNGVEDDSGTFSAAYTTTGPFEGEMMVTRLTGTALADLTFRLHFEHHFPVDAVIDRFEAFTVALPPGLPESHEGTWRRLPN